MKAMLLVGEGVRQEGYCSLSVRSLFRATPEAHGSSQARGGIGAAAAGHSYQSHNNARSKLHL